MYFVVINGHHSPFFSLKDRILKNSLHVVFPLDYYKFANAKYIVYIGFVYYVVIQSVKCFLPINVYCL